ncbi:hypothetical protein J2795_004666 [Chryseobacterium bernardetii]|uniref:Uncharacterized protein n=2 Tax=Chryseobacterium TaxID=59732 RepID=A0ACC6J2B8_9FLAO|nr:hypothetical protein [Chryseobacterium vietnamense]MDR6443911.1 hypothetical protein [Chryseobacterium bernardetii]MDR6461517.1 hypothetical protein [Chryseobacterium vietnamense]
MEPKTTFVHQLEEKTLRSLTLTVKTSQRENRAHKALE